MPQIVTDTAILLAARNAIEVLLRFKGTQITLTPRRGAIVIKPGGGHDFEPADPRPPQLLALSRAGITDNISDAETDEQQLVTRTYFLTGRHDAQIEVGDVWSDGEADYIVDAVDNTSGYKVSATVTGWVKLVGAPEDHVDHTMPTKSYSRFPFEFLPESENW